MHRSAAHHCLIEANRSIDTSTHHVLRRSVLVDHTLRALRQTSVVCDGIFPWACATGLSDRRSGPAWVKLLQTQRTPGFFGRGSRKKISTDHLKAVTT